MSRFDRCVDKLIEMEGGYSDHSSDRGGKTKYGITERTAKDHGYTGEMRDLTLEEAKDIYKTYWSDRFDDEDLLESVAGFFFDMRVNHGAGNAARIVQKALVKLDKDVDVDGILGPATMAALKEVGSSALDAMADERKAFYRAIVENDPSQEVFLKGWLNRVEDAKNKY